MSIIGVVENGFINFPPGVHLPDGTKVEITFLLAVNEAEQDISEGRLVANEQMEARITEWTDN